MVWPKWVLYFRDPPMMPPRSRLALLLSQRLAGGESSFKFPHMAFSEIWLTTTMYRALQHGGVFSQSV